MIIRICLLFALSAAIFAVLSGAWMQYELAAPGIQQVGNDSDLAAIKQAYMRSVPLHMIFAGYAMPLSLCVALSAALWSEKSSNTSGNLIAIGILIAACALVLFGAEASYLASPGALGLVLLVSLVGSGAAALSARLGRTGALIYYVAGGLASGACVLLYGLVYQAQDTSVLADTYVATGLSHLAGLALSLLMLSTLAVWSARRGRAGKWTVTFALAAIIFVTGVVMIVPTISLGLQGMPRGYIDYPERFAGLHRLVSLGAGTFVVMMLIAAGRSVWLSRLLQPAPSEEFS